MTLTPTSTDARLLIGGRSVVGELDAYPVHNPARPAETVGLAAATSPRQLDEAVAAARSAFRDWRCRPLAERISLVQAAADTVTATAELARLYTQEHGKPVADAEFEVSSVPLISMITASMAEEALADQQVDPNAAHPRVTFAPYGVVAVLLPFNWPVAILMMKLTPALLAGNTVVLKTPPTCPLTVSAIVAALADALPPGVLNLVGGPDADLGRSLVTHLGVDMVSFTGGIPTGKAVMAAAAERLTPVLLELGGNDAAILGPDVELTDDIVERLYQSVFATSGQVCMAIKRLYVPEERVGDVADALLERCERVVVGDGLAPGVDVGPMHTARGRDFVESLLRDAGDGVRRAGTIRPEDADSDGYFVRPAVVVAPDPSSGIVTEEQFGPAVPVLPYASVAEAVDAANSTTYGLTASLWTADDALADEILPQLEAGSVALNCHGMSAMDPRVPFGGWRQSGVGRELGVEGIRAYTQTRAFLRRPLH